MLLTKRGKANQKILFDWLRENNAFDKYIECIRTYDENPDKQHNVNDYVRFLNRSCLYSAFAFRCNWNNFDEKYWNAIGTKLMADLIRDRIKPI